jgi:flagellar protein FlaH
MSRAKVRVLFVEDSLQDAAIVRRVLHKDERLDLDVDCVHSAGECLERLKEETFDVLLLDYNLPGENGLALLGGLQGRAGLPPIIMLSGWGDEKVAEEAKRRGAYGYCSQNSIISGALTAKIHEALGVGDHRASRKRLAVDELPRRAEQLGNTGEQQKVPPAAETGGTGQKPPGDELQQRVGPVAESGNNEEKPSSDEPPQPSDRSSKTDEDLDYVADERMISTGNANLDYRLGGGIPRGSLTLIDGQSGAGKSVFTQQLTWGALKYGRRVVLYSNENTKESLLSQMDSLGMDVSDYFAQGKLQVLDIPGSRLDEQTSPNLDMLLRDIHRLRNCDLVVVDSLTGFLARPADDEVIPFLTHCKQFYSQGKTIIATVHADVFGDSALGRMISICDVYLRLRIATAGDRLVKRLEVNKVRGASKATGRIISFDVEPGVGIVPTILMTKVQA